MPFLQNCHDQFCIKSKITNSNVNPASTPKPGLRSRVLPDINIRSKGSWRLEDTLLRAMIVLMSLLGPPAFLLLSGPVHLVCLPIDLFHETSTSQVSSSLAQSEVDGSSVKLKEACLWVKASFFILVDSGHYLIESWDMRISFPRA